MFVCLLFFSVSSFCFKSAGWLYVGRGSFELFVVTSWLQEQFLLDQRSRLRCIWWLRRVAMTCALFGAACLWLGAQVRGDEVLGLLGVMLCLVHLKRPRAAKLRGPGGFEARRWHCFHAAAQGAEFQEFPTRSRPGMNFGPWNVSPLSPETSGKASSDSNHHGFYAFSFWHAVRPRVCMFWVFKTQKRKDTRSADQLSHQAAGLPCLTAGQDVAGLGAGDSELIAQFLAEEERFSRWQMLHMSM